MSKYVLNFLDIFFSFYHYMYSPVILIFNQLAPLYLLFSFPDPVSLFPSSVFPHHLISSPASNGFSTLPQSIHSSLVLMFLYSLPQHDLSSTAVVLVTPCFPVYHKFILFLTLYYTILLFTHSVSVLQGPFPTFHKHNKAWQN